MTETDEGGKQRRFPRPRLVVPAALAALLLAGGSVWALSGGGDGPTAPVAVGTATPSATVSPTAEPSPTAAPTPTTTATATPTEASPSPSPSMAAEPAPASVEPAADEPESSAPAAPRKPAAKASDAPAAKSQGAAPAAKPKAPAAPAGQDPHDMAPVPCTNCRTEPQEPDPQHTCIHDAAGRLITCSPTQVGIPHPPSSPDPTFTPGSSH